MSTAKRILAEEQAKQAEKETPLFDSVETGTETAQETGKHPLEKQTENLDELPPVNFSDADYDKAFSAAAEKTAREVTGEILSAKIMAEGEEKLFIFQGMGNATDSKTGELRAAAVLMDKNKNSFLAPSLVIVQALENVVPGTVIKLVSLGMKEGKNNKYWNVKVFIF